MPASVPTYPLPSASSLETACEQAARQLAVDILLIHATVTGAFGSLPTILSPGLLDAAAHRPFHMFGGSGFLYPTGLRQAAALMHSLVKNHVFEDGNKRTASTSTLFFLERCGYWEYGLLLTEKESREFEHLTVLIAGERGYLEQGILPHPISIEEIAEALDDILGAARRRKPRPARLLAGLFRTMPDLFP